MHSKNIKLYTFFLLCSVFLGCGHSIQKEKEQSKSTQYAEGFSIENKKGYTTIKVFDPWKKGHILAIYHLIKNKDISTPPTDGIKIKIPIKKLASSSVTHLEFLDLIDELHTLKGFCKPDIVYNKTVRTNAKLGKISDLGDAFSINIEKTIGLQPDIFLVSGYNQADANIQRIADAGIPIVYDNEWMETSLLGRAEWIKFVAAFYDKSHIADSIFSEIAKRYNTIISKAKNNGERPTILSGSNFRGTWYMPGGKSYMGKLYRDAQADYHYENDSTTGSLPLSIEVVLKNFAQADVWLNCNYDSITELVNADDKHKLFAAVKKRNVYNFNKRRLQSRANDFWESAIAHPDLLLGDVIAVLHPDVLPTWEFVYTNRLSE